MRYNSLAMDPMTTSVVSAVMGVVMPYVTKGAEEFAKLAGEAAFQKAKGLMDTVRKRFAADSEAAAVITQFEQKPQRYEPVVSDILAEKVEADPAFARELKKQVDALGPELVIIQRIRDADSVTGLELGEMRSGKAGVRQDIEGGRNITGAKIDKLG
jgi:hypothetical protein